MGKLRVQEYDVDQLLDMIPEKSSVLGFVKRGDICDTIVDVETTCLSQDFAKPTGLAAVIADPFTSQVIHIHERDIAVTKDSVFGAIPSLITDKRPETFEKGMREDLAVRELYDLILDSPRYIADHYKEFRGRVQEYNEGKSKEDKIPLPPAKSELKYHYVSNKRTKADRLAGKKELENSRIAKDVVFIPSKNEEGKIVYDFAISGNGKQVYYKENDIWHRIDKAKKTVIMHNSRADNNWIWGWNFKYLMPDQFITHTKWHGAYLFDTLPASREVNQLGAWEGREKLILPTRKDPDFGDVPSASKANIMKANTRLKNPRLRLGPGITLPDGSHQDEELEHGSPAYDCLETYGMYLHYKRISPEIVEYKKRISDRDVLKTELSPPHEKRPIISFVRARYPYLGKHMGVVLNTDIAYGDFKRGIALTLTSLIADPKDDMLYLYDADGKKRNIVDMETEDWLKLFQVEAKENGANGVLEVFALNKNPMIQTAETGMRSGANHDIPYNELQRRRDLVISMPFITDRIMGAFEEYLLQVKQNPTDKYPDVQPEELRFNGVGDPQRIQVFRPDRDYSAKDMIESAIHERAKVKWEFFKNRNRFIRLIIAPNVALEGDENIGLEPEEDAYKKYQVEVNKALSAYHRSVRAKKLKMHPQIEDLGWPKKKKFESNEEAQKFIWEMRERALTENWFVDYTADQYYIVDKETGREVPQTRFQDIEVIEFNQNFDVNKGCWDVEFEEQFYSQYFLAEMFVRAGKEDKLMALNPDWETWIEAKRVQAHNGTPFKGPNEQRHPTNESELLVLERIKRNAQQDSINRKSADIKRLSTDPDIASGMYNELIESLPAKQEHVAELEAYYKRNIKRFQWDRDSLDIRGYDPGTKMPKDNILYQVPVRSFNKAKKITIPEDAPLRPMQDPDFGEMVYALPWSKRLDDMWKKGQLSNVANRVFKTEATGRHYLAPKAEFQKVVLGKDPALRNLWQQVSRVFEDSGIENYPADKPVFLVNAEGLVPFAGTRVVDPILEFQVPGQNRFKALLAPELAGYHNYESENGKQPEKRKRLTGMAIPDYEYTEERGYNLTRGSKLRLREMDDKTGTETGWELEVKLTAAPKYWTLEEFEDAYMGGKVTNQFARNYGFADSRTMYAEVANWFTSKQRSKDDPQNRILLMRFSPAKKKDMVYFNPAVPPRAAVIERHYQTKNKFMDMWGGYPTQKTNKPS